MHVWLNDIRLRVCAAARPEAPRRPIHPLTDPADARTRCDTTSSSSASPLMPSTWSRPQKTWPACTHSKAKAKSQLRVSPRLVLPRPLCRQWSGGVLDWPPLPSLVEKRHAYYKPTLATSYLRRPRFPRLPALQLSLDHTPPAHRQRRPGRRLPRATAAQLCAASSTRMRHHLH